MLLSVLLLLSSTFLLTEPAGQPSSALVNSSLWWMFLVETRPSHLPSGCECESVSVWLWSLPSRGKRRALSALVGKHWTTFHHLHCTIMDFSLTPPRAHSLPTGQAHIKDNRTRLNVRKCPLRCERYRSVGGCTMCFLPSLTENTTDVSNDSDHFNELINRSHGQELDMIQGAVCSSSLQKLFSVKSFWFLNNY